MAELNTKAALGQRLPLSCMPMRPIDFRRNTHIAHYCSSGIEVAFWPLYEGGWWCEGEQVETDSRIKNKVISWLERKEMRGSQWWLMDGRSQWGRFHHWLEWDGTYRQNYYMAGTNKSSYPAVTPSIKYMSVATDSRDSRCINQMPLGLSLGCNHLESFLSHDVRISKVQGILKCPE